MGISYQISGIIYIVYSHWKPIYTMMIKIDTECASTYNIPNNPNHIFGFTKLYLYIYIATTSLIYLQVRLGLPKVVIKLYLRLIVRLGRVR